MEASTDGTEADEREHPVEVLGRDIGDGIDRMYREILSRVQTEPELELRIEAFDGALSNVRWTDDAVVVQLNEAVPTHALPHVLGVALMHVRQRLDQFPDIRRPAGEQVEGTGLLRTSLRETVLAPEAESHLAPLALDQKWETEQRHLGFKQLLDDAPEQWRDQSSIGAGFVALQYAKLEFMHPEAMWTSLRKRTHAELPEAAEMGDMAVTEIRRFRWGSAQACVQSLVAVRDVLGMQRIAQVLDRRSDIRY